MTPRKKDPLKTPETVTSSVEEDSSICSEAGEGSCPKSSVAKDDKNASC